MIKDGISIILPTFRRPDGLEIALSSAARQNVQNCAVEIIVADNDPQGSARQFVEAFAAAAPIPVHYLHVPAPGVSNARNAALKAAKGRYLAFLDDDQEAGPGWLEVLYAITKTHKAGLSFVPTYARIPGNSAYNDYLETFFSRTPVHDDGVIERFYGCGNSMLDTKLCALPSPPFSLAMNETGGEDDYLFSELVSQGITIAWSNKALTHEDIRPHRATPAYVKTRSFANGQGPSQECADRKSYLGIAKWMMIGAGQYIIYAPIAALCKLTGRPAYIKYLAKAAEGSGKVLWFGGFTPKLYGAAAAENTVF